jgi:hypothetical protein
MRFDRDTGECACNPQHVKAGDQCEPCTGGKIVEIRTGTCVCAGKTPLERSGRCEACPRGQRFDFASLGCRPG